MFKFLKSLFEPKMDLVLAEKMQNRPFLVDVRTPIEFGQGHLQDSVNIPLNTLSSNLAKFKGKKNIVLFCRSGNRSGQAAAILRGKGITDVYNGGSWQNVKRYMDV